MTSPPRMKVIIAGSRSITDLASIITAIELSRFEISEVVSGGARGVDQLGEEWAKRNKIPVKQFLPRWSIGKTAGFIRNGEMAIYADALIAVWDGSSRGTHHMINTMEAMGKPVFVYEHRKS